MSEEKQDDIKDFGKKAVIVFFIIIATLTILGFVGIPIDLLKIKAGIPVCVRVDK